MIHLVLLLGVDERVGKMEGQQEEMNTTLEQQVQATEGAWYYRLLKMSQMLLNLLQHLKNILLRL